MTFYFLGINIYFDEMNVFGGSNMRATNELGTKKVSSLLLSLAIPSIIAMIVNLLYNMVDRIYR